MSEYPKRSTTLIGRFRDDLAYRVFLLGHKIATPWYSSMVTGAVRYGLLSAVRDSQEGRESPDPVRYGRP